MIIFSEYGITIIQRDERFFLLEDVGHFGIEMRETEITKEQAEGIQAQTDIDSMADYLLKNIDPYYE